MSYKAGLIYAWIIYITNILITFSVDYYIRVSGDDFYHSGLNETVWITIIILAVLGSIYFIVNATKHINKNLYKIIYLLTNVFLGFIFYAIVSYLYIVNFGIDSV